MNVVNTIKLKSEKNKFRFVNMCYAREMNSKLYYYIV